MAEEPLKKVLQRAMRDIVENDIPQDIRIILKKPKEEIDVENLENALFLATQVNVIIKEKVREIKYDEIESFKRIAKKRL